MSNIFGTNTTSNLMSVAETAQTIMQGKSLTESSDWLEAEMEKVQYKWPRTNPKIKKQWLKKITARAEKDGMDMSAGGEFEDRLDDYELTIHAEDKVWTEASKIKSKWKKMSTAERTRWLDKIDDLARKQNTSDEDVRAIRDEFGLHMSEEVEVAENFAVLNEALKPRDKAVIDAFYSRKGNLASNLLSVEGGKLTKMGMGGQEIAIWKNDKIVINAKMDVKSTEEIVRYMKKSIPSGVFEEVEIAEGWKKGKYTIKDENGKILGTYSSGGKAKKVMDDLMQKGDYPELTVSMVEEVEVDENFAVLNEALKPRDKAVIDAFYSRKGNLASNLLSVEGGKLTKMGMGGQEIAIWKNDKIVINAKMDVKSTEEIVRYMKKSIPSGVFEEVEIAEGWKKGKYTIKDENGKILGTYSSGGKAKKVMDDLMQKGDYPELTVSMVEEVEITEATHDKKGTFTMAPFEDLRGVADVALKIMQGQPQEVKEEEQEVTSEETPQKLTE